MRELSQLPSFKLTGGRSFINWRFAACLYKSPKPKHRK